MGATLEALHRLQQIELELAEVERKVEAKRRAVRNQQRRIEQLDEQIQRERQEILNQQREADRLELEYKSREAKISKLRESLNRAKTNREYSAILTELNTDKADNAKLGDRILQMMTNLDERKKALEEMRARREAEAARLGRLQQEQQAAEQEVAGQIAALQERRREAAEAVPPTVLRIFERVAERYEGEAMAQAIRTHPRREEYVCGGCHMAVTLEQISALQTSDDVQTCHTCGKILYLEPPQEPS